MRAAFILTTSLRVLRRIACVIFCSCAIVVVVACGEIGYFNDVIGERIIVGRVCFMGGVVCVEARDHCNIEQVHLLGDS